MSASTAGIVGPSFRIAQGGRVPLAVRCRDAVGGGPVLGLRAVAWTSPAGGGLARPEPAHGGPDGIYRFDGLAGVGAVWRRPGVPVACTVCLTDPEARFLSTCVRLEIQATEAGELRGTDAGGATAPMPWPLDLYPAPTRPPQPAWAVIRATLHDAGSQRPAAFARLRASVAGVSGEGVADAAGGVAVWLPAPALLPALQPPRGDPAWPVTIRAFARPGGLSPVPGAAAPDQVAVLAQPPAAVWLDPGGPGPSGEGVVWPDPLTPADELVLRTRTRSALWISAQT